MQIFHRLSSSLHECLMQIYLHIFNQTGYYPFYFFTFLTQGDLSTATFYRQQFWNTLKVNICIQFFFIQFYFSFQPPKFSDSYIFSKDCFWVSGADCVQNLKHELPGSSEYALTHASIAQFYSGAREHPFLGFLWELEANFPKRRLSKVEHSFFYQITYNLCFDSSL